MVPDLMARLCEAALRTRAVNSVGVTSAMESRWRGAKGDIGGVVGVGFDEYVRRALKRRRAGELLRPGISFKLYITANQLPL